MSNFTEIHVSSLSDNFFTRIGKEWMLITAGNKSSFNTMTASWGGTGFLWNKNIAITFIRPSRYTYDFVDHNEYYTLSFFGGKMKEELTFCGRNSGRDVDKIKETGLVPVFDEKAPYFEQADLVIVCKKLYKQPMNRESFIDKELAESIYPDGAYHHTFIGEIVKVLKKA